MADKSILFDILARDRASDAFQSAGRSADQLTDSTSKVGSVAKAALLGATAAVGAFAVKLGGDAIDAAKESIKVSAQTEAALKSTGAAAWVTADQIGAQAHSLQNLSGVSDEAIQSGQNMLLTFTNLQNRVGAGNDIFSQATKTLLDMSVATGNDMTSSAVQLGKALNDPIAGISSLTRVGVTFTDQQKAQIETMVRQGDVAGAQKIILAELSKEFGGSAKAQGDALTQGERLSLKWGDMQEQLGTWLIPKIDSLISSVTSASEWFKRNEDVLVPLVVVLGAFTLGVIAANVAVTTATAVAAAFGVTLTIALGPVALITGAIALLAAGLIYAYTHSETFRSIVQGAFAVVGAGATFMRDLVAMALRGLVDAFLGSVEWIIKAAAAAFGWVPGVGDKLKGAARAVEGFRDEVNAALGGIRDKTVNITFKGGGGGDFGGKGASGSWDIPGRAVGGPVDAFRPYIVGEMGPEMFVPKVAGTIVPNHAMAAASSDSLPDMAYWEQAGAVHGRASARAQASELRLQMRSA
jgi:hypothetical protein